ncbi:MAG: UvrD-helicase domain-containing protein [Prevotella sp.]|nr:UvrD-helicase domain-containing protein [Prevotella sp.]
MKEKSNYSFQPDESQRRVITVQGGYHLVLAPPGCGKTQILTERIRHAHENEGIPYEQMLCLTFTNRAARGMQERIQQRLADVGVGEVYVGNIHRFCSKFLFENNVIPAETSIIDEDDCISILSRYFDEDESQVMENINRRKAYYEVIHFSHFILQLSHGHPKELRMHPECMTADDVTALRSLSTLYKKPFDAATLTDIYAHTDFYTDALHTSDLDMGIQTIAARTLRKMELARQFEQYKNDNKLVDFEDLLIQAYDAMRTSESHRTYSWIQVDEVQDLNPLQLAIVDLITTPSSSSLNSPPSSLLPLSTVMYLGDEQQAIFSFMGAKLTTLDMLRQRCGRQVHHLSTNHRSPKYLLDVFNEYARVELGISPALLPKPSHASHHSTPSAFPHGEAEGTPAPSPLRILRSNVLETEFYDVAHVAQMLNEASPHETTAVIVNSNSDADHVSEELLKLSVPHFKVSGDDLFGSTEMKLLLAHLSVLSNEHNFIAWARIMKGTRVCEQNAYARNFIRVLLDHAMLPSDFLLYADSTYVQEYVLVCENKDIVVFDTETTGLSMSEDDIVQIAAVRMRQGRVVPGSEFNVYIETSREIPPMLGDIPNPIIEERKHHRLHSHAEALQMFLDYAAGDVLLGHNADFDYHILDANLSRYLSQRLADHHPVYFDSLKLIRLLQPDLKEYKLKYLLAVLGLEGENSHLADADVLATCSLMNHCYQRACEVIPGQRSFMATDRVKNRVATLRRNYGELYLQARKQRFETTEDGIPALVRELVYAHRYLCENAFIESVRQLNYVTRYLTEDMLDNESGMSLHEQLAAHIVEINTLKEADLCNSRSIEDRVFVSTVHKAKGLEFDNVIVFDAVEDRYPSYFNRNSPTGIDEDARKFYVAMTRAKHRLYISQCLTRMDYRGQVRPRQLTRFMNSIQKFFS